MFTEKLYEKAGREFNFKFHKKGENFIFIPESKVGISSKPLEIIGVKSDDELIEKCAKHAKDVFEDLDTFDKVLGEKIEPKKEEEEEVAHIPPPETQTEAEAPPPQSSEKFDVEF